ncbi:MAG: glutamate--tRNA ligase [Gammaproteobacteria bacterium]
MKPVRTRIAPSPTGDPHVGTAYIALFNQCFAKQHGGQFILRIEDTDQQRSTVAAEAAILRALRWIGLTWDEGPDVGGDCGPYRQSERAHIYQQYAQQLVDKGLAFYCFRTPEELNAIREARKTEGLTPGFKLPDPELAPETVQARLAAGDPHVIRMKVPMSGTCLVKDRLRGVVEIPWAQVDMQILLKSDGLPTYHLANVVDDHLMGITHVIRGEEWINSTPKHQLLYEYFGWEAPEFCHMPLLRNPDKSKLSKRKNPTSILFYQRMGYLPQALLNYLGMMGWSFPDGRDKFTLEEMIAEFDVDRVSLGGPVFDQDKLRWLNGRYIRENLSAADFAQTLQEWAFNEPYINDVLEQIQSRVELLSDVADKGRLFFMGLPELTPDDLAMSALSSEQVGELLQLSAWALESVADWTKENVYHALNCIAQALDIRMKVFMTPIFVAIAGSSVAPPIMDAMVTLGPDLSRARLRHALKVLAMPSKKQAKAWQKCFETIDFNPVSA